MTVRRLPWMLPGIVAAIVLLGILYPRPGSSTSSAHSALVGTDLAEMPAPGFSLHNQFGQRITLAHFRGHPVIVTFLGATCTTLCPVVAETIHRIVEELGNEAKRVRIVAISTDPEHDTPAAVRKFSVQHGLLHGWNYLVGTRTALTPIWRAYHLYVAPKNAPQQLANAHTSATYLIDANGRERILVTEAPDPVALDRDVRILLGISAVSIAQSAIPAPQAGHPAPVLVLPGLTGGVVRLAALKGQIVMLNFWATWCNPCKSEMPAINRWYEGMKRQGVVVVGVDQQEGPGDVKSFVNKLGIRYPIVLDADGTVSARFDVAGLPTTLIIDRRGIVHSYKAGILDASYLASQMHWATKS